jgi:DMSO/TMAO reductase YedYZ molybdopterin-dependent catalytic subunit
LFVRNHTATPTIDPATYALQVYGDGLRAPRTAGEPLTLTLAQLRRLPRTTLITTHECTGNGRSFFGTQQGTPASGTQWTLGAVGTVSWTGVRLREVLDRIGLDPAAVSIQAAGLDASYVSGGVDYGPVRRPFPVSKALDDALLAWDMNGEPLPDHGHPLRQVLPGWPSPGARGAGPLPCAGSRSARTVARPGPGHGSAARASAAGPSGPGCGSDPPPATTS